MNTSLRGSGYGDDELALLNAGSRAELAGFCPTVW
jgi:hypothetical protein